MCSKIYRKILGLLSESSFIKVFYLSANISNSISCLDLYYFYLLLNIYMATFVKL